MTLGFQKLRISLIASLSFFCLIFLFPGCTCKVLKDKHGVFLKVRVEIQGLSLFADLFDKRLLTCWLSVHFNFVIRIWVYKEWLDFGSSLSSKYFEAERPIVVSILKLSVMKKKLQICKLRGTILICADRKMIKGRIASWSQ